MPRRILLLLALMAAVIVIPTWTAPVPFPKAQPKEIINSIGMKLVRIPTGKFTMGSPNDEKDRGDDEQQHEVVITNAFWIGVHEVTQGQFKAVMGYNPSSCSRDGQGKPGVGYDPTSGPATNKELVPANTSNFPVENVSHDEATEFCNKLSGAVKERGRLYRLPTEAEWEYACRGGSAAYQVFAFGNSFSPTQANMGLNGSCKVGSYKKNRFGLFDMHGNVWEWCADWYGKDYYGKSPVKDPSGPREGMKRVVRGGGYYNGDTERPVRSASRLQADPSGQACFLGFRVAAVLAAK